MLGHPHPVTWLGSGVSPCRKLASSSPRILSLRMRAMQGSLIRALPCACGARLFEPRHVHAGTGSYLTSELREMPDLPLKCFWPCGPDKSCPISCLGLQEVQLSPLRMRSGGQKNAPTSTPKAPGFEPRSFGVRGWRSNHYAIHAKVGEGGIFGALPIK